MANKKMTMQEYQNIASNTMSGKRNELDIYIYGLIGELGSLMTCFKKRKRDGENGYLSFKDDVKEEMGDLLWYISAIASKLGIELEDIAKQNISKVKDMWQPYSNAYNLYDENCVEKEKIPRRFTIVFKENRKGQVEISHLVKDKPKKLGNELSDNSNIEDDYRYHDIFHISYATILGWSPIIRGKYFLNCKRKSNPDKDNIEDGGRAWVIEEAISVIIFNYAQKHGLYKKTQDIDFNLIKLVKELTKHHEVSSRSAADWKKAILEGYKIFRKLKENKGGVVIADLKNRKLTYRKK